MFEPIRGVRRPDLRWPAAIAVVTCALLASASPALAAPPANDNFADRQSLGNGLTPSVSGTNVDATKEPGEPNHGYLFGVSSIWYGWTPPATGVYLVSSCTSDFNNTFRAYTGATLTTLGSGDLGPNCAFPVNASDRVTGTEGTELKIAIDGGADFNIPTTISEEGTISFALAPSDDIFAGATDLGSAAPVSATGGVSGYRKETGEPNHAGRPAMSSKWLTWTPATFGRYVVDLCDSDFDTLLGVYTGTAVNALTAVASNNDGCGRQSRLVFDAAAGTPYRIAVDKVLGTNGDAVDLEITEIVHDHFVNALDLGDEESAMSPGNNVDASEEPGEPDHAENAGGASIWHSWEAPATGQVTIDTCESNFDTLLGVYTGPSVGTLDEVASDDDGCGSGSAVTFEATEGETYRIAVDGFKLTGAVRPQTGSFTLNLAPGPPPDGDGDGASDFIDNCVDDTNPGQEDFDGDEDGDACDPDADGDDTEDTSDECLLEYGESVNGCPLRLLTIDVSGPGQVIVTDSFGDYSCPADFCDALYDDDDVVSMTATPNAGAALAELSGAGCTGSPTCTVTLDQDQSVLARFTQTSLPPAPLPANPGKVKPGKKPKCKGKSRKRCKKKSGRAIRRAYSP